MMVLETGHIDLLWPDKISVPELPTKK